MSLNKMHLHNSNDYIVYTHVKVQEFNKAIVNIL